MQKSDGKLPLLISVPHGGYRVPMEIADALAIQHRNIFFDCDPFTREIYNFRDDVLHYHDSCIARTVVDLNRSVDDLPPSNTDGVFKSHTVRGDKVYHEHLFPKSSLRDELLKRYYFPYHSKITKDMNDPEILCCLDCHSMLDYLPGQHHNIHARRPFICLSNNGDEYGEQSDGELTCPPEMIHLLAEVFRLVFPEEKNNILINSPFKGGHISKHHSSSLPWIQVEINRKAYLNPLWFDTTTLRVSPKRIRFLHQTFLQAFSLFCSLLEESHYTNSLVNDNHSGYSVSL